jgi:hypothetical protein
VTLGLLLSNKCMGDLNGQQNMAQALAYPGYITIHVRPGRCSNISMPDIYLCVGKGIFK